MLEAEKGLKHMELQTYREKWAAWLRTLATWCVWATIASSLVAGVFYLAAIPLPSWGPLAIAIAYLGSALFGWACHGLASWLARGANTGGGGRLVGWEREYRLP